MEKALISVIIPVYNVEKYLRECVESVLNQTYLNYEIILVDDGSTDSSGKICDEYSENEKVTVVHQKNAGLSAARNRGFDASRGEYVYYLDSDDYILPQTLSTLYSEATNNNSDVVFFDAVSFADGDFKVNQNYIRKTVYEKCSGPEMLQKLQGEDEYHSAVPLLFIRKSLIVDNNLRFVDGIFYEDMVYTYQIFCCAKVVSQYKEAFYYRRYRQSSIMTSRKNKKHFQSAEKVYCEVRNYAISSDNLHNETSKKYIIRCAYNVFNIFEKLEKSEKKEMKSKLKNFKNDVLQNSAYGDNALKMRCFGKLFWFVYKVFEKVLRR